MADDVLIKDANNQDVPVATRDKGGREVAYVLIDKGGGGANDPIVAVDDANPLPVADGTVRTALGAPADAAATGDGSIIGILKRIRDRLVGTLTVSGPLTDEELRAAPLANPTGAATAAHQVTANAALGAPADAAANGDGSIIGILKRIRDRLVGTLTVQGPLTDAELRAAAVPVQGPLTDAELRAGAVPVNAAATDGRLDSTNATLGTTTDAAAAAAGTGDYGLIAAVKRALLNWAALLSRLPAALGIQAPTGSFSVVQSSDVSVTGPSAQSAINTDLLSGTVNGWYDAGAFQSGSVQIIASVGISAGAVIFEQTNDTSLAPAGVALRAYEASSISVNPQVAAITIAASTQRVFTVPINSRFIRARISTAFVGGTVQAVATFSQRAASFPTVNIQQATAGNLNAQVVGAAGAGAAHAGNPVLVGGSDGTNAQRLRVDGVGNLIAAAVAPLLITDVASAALTTTTTTATVTPSHGNAYQVVIPVTAVTGTTPTLDVGIEESDDGGTNWVRVYDFPRITATGAYRSPVLPWAGNRVRYVQTVGGTTPSFTRAISRSQIGTSVNPIRQIVDRALAINTLNSVTASLNVQNCRNLQAVLTLGAVTTTPPTIQIEGSDDNGANWYALGNTLVGVANSTVRVAANDVQAQLVRVRVSAAGTGATLTTLTLKGY